MAYRECSINGSAWAQSFCPKSALGNDTDIVSRNYLMVPALNSVHRNRASHSHKTVVIIWERRWLLSNWLISSKDPGERGLTIIGLTTHLPYL